MPLIIGKTSKTKVLVLVTWHACARTWPIGHWVLASVWNRSSHLGMDWAFDWGPAECFRWFQSEKIPTVNIQCPSFNYQQQQRQIKSGFRKDRRYFGEWCRCATASLSHPVEHLHKLINACHKTIGVWNWMLKNKKKYQTGTPCVMMHY